MNCKYCNEEFSSKSILACHVRWKHSTKNNLVSCQYCKKTFQTANIVQHENGCSKNPKNIHTCQQCGKDTTNENFCSRKCSNIFNNINSKTGFKRQILDNCHPMLTNPKYEYIIHRKICEQHWEMKCPICGWDKCVDVHHIDGNHDNDEPRNLIPLCQNHHTISRMKKYKEEMDLTISKLVENKFGALDQR